MEKIPWIVSTAVTITGKKNSHDIIIVDQIILVIIIVISIVFLGMLFHYIFRQKRLRHYRDHHYSQVNKSHTEMNT